MHATRLAGHPPHESLPRRTEQMGVSLKRPFIVLAWVDSCGSSASLGLTGRLHSNVDRVAPKLCGI